MSETATTGTAATAETTTASAAQTAAPASSTTTEAAAAPAAYYEAFPDDLKTNPAIQKYKSAEELARGLIAAENRLGTPADQLLRLPKGLDDKEGLATIMKALGAPETADGYKLADGLAADASDADRAMVGDFAAAMHGVNAPPHIVAEAMKWFAGYAEKAQAAQAEAQTQAGAAAETALKTEWGAAYEANMKAVGALFNQYGGEELTAEMNKAGMANNPRLMVMLGKMVERMAEPGTLDGATRASTGVMTPAAATAARKALEADPLKMAALLDKNHSLHAEVVAERGRYFKLERGVTA